MSSQKRAKSLRSDDTMDDDSDDKDTKRKSRNLSEKKRRDQFNLLVNELSSMVSTSGRKMDKSTVLKSTISFLKSHNEIAVRSRVHEIQEDWKPSFLTNEEFTHLILEAVDGFIIVFSTAGQIFYASESITSLLGYLPSEILNTLIYDLTSEEERSSLYKILLNPVKDEGQVTFSCYLRRGSFSLKHHSYELVHFIGYFRSDADVVQSDGSYSGYSVEADARLVFVGTGRLHTPQLIRETSLHDSGKNEFTSRHSLEWKFLFLDHRAPPIIGYLPFELLGTSGYDYYHVDDLEKVVDCHITLMKKGEGTSCYYRFLTKGQQWIWLQTRFYITYHQWNSKPEFIVCTHQVVSYVDVIKRNRRGEDDETDDPEVIAPSTTYPPTSWQKENSKGRYNQDLGSDCTSMSADSPTSRTSTVTRHSVLSKTSLSVTSNVPESPQESQQFVKPAGTQYVAAIPVFKTDFPASGLLSPMQPIEISTEQSQLQADLQRKHAELQASIGQQQAELRAISEQLLMTRLGLLPPTQQESLSYSYANSASITSTTTTTSLTGVTPSLPICTIAIEQSELLTPLVSAPSSLTVSEHSSIVYVPPDSNTPPK